MTQELARAGDAGRAMDQCQRPSAHVRQNPFTDRFVIARELEFGKIEIGVDHSLRMRHANTGNDSCLGTHTGLGCNSDAANARPSRQ